MSRKLTKVKQPKKGRRARRAITEFSLGETASYLQDMWSLARAGWSLFNTEIKMFDVSQAPYSYNYTGNMQYLCGIAQGTDYNQRTGNSIKVVGVELMANMTLNVNACSARSLLFADRESRGTAPTAAELLEAGGGALGVLCPYEHKSVNRFQIIKDTVAHWGEASVTTTPVRYQRCLIPMQHHVAWNGTTGAQADSGEQSLYFYVQTDSVTAASGTTSFWVRLFYVDN